MKHQKHPAVRGGVGKGRDTVYTRAKRSSLHMPSEGPSVAYTQRGCHDRPFRVCHRTENQ